MLVLPTAYKARKRLVKVLHNPYTKEENIERERHFSYEDLWSGIEQAHVGWADLREEVLFNKGTTCALCGTVLHPSEVERDHILPRTRFKDPWRLIAWITSKFSVHHATEQRRRLIGRCCAGCHESGTSGAKRGG
jgi:5-methylcytosine-specific restriction endonuclease McrA